MNEADASNNRAVMESLNSANSLQPEQAICPFYSVMPSENMVIAKAPLLKAAENEQHQIPNSHSPENPTPPDWVAEPDSEQQTLINTEFKNLLALNEELRAANTDLYKQVEHIKDNLAESEKALQWQKRRSSVTESMLNQQTQELAADQEQIQSLFQQLETAVQTVQRQETFIETHKTQLQISQQRLAQLERECALLQTNYNENSQQLLQSENACRELRTRLMRQQRQTLQFKAALEKCLETPVPSDNSLDETENHSSQTPSQQTRFSKKARSLFPNVQPIKPWSAEPESWTDNLNHRDESPVIPYKNDNPAPYVSSPWNWPPKEAEIREQENKEAEESPYIDSHVPLSSLGSSQLDEQLDSLIQMFFTSQPVSTPPQPPVIETNVDSSSQADATVWETWETSFENDEIPKTPLEQKFAEEINPPINISTSVVDDSTVSPVNSSPLSFTLSLTETTGEEPENYWLETPQLNQVEFSATDLPQDSWDDSNNDTQSPSPVVYPQRPPKRRKSLASVELPNFRPIN